MHMARTTKTKSGALVRHTRWRALLLLAFVGLVVYVAAGDGILYDVWQQERELADLEAQVGQLEAQNDSLRQILHLLENDPSYMEKLAREKLGLRKPGESVISLPLNEGD